METPKIIWIKNKAYIGANRIGYIETTDGGGYYIAYFYLRHDFFVKRKAMEHYFPKFEEAQKCIQAEWNMFWNKLWKKCEKCVNCPYLS